MRLICPGCGLTASAEAWLNDTEARETMQTLTKLPPELHGQLLPYLGLFRPESRALSWKKAARLMAELSQLTGLRHVQVQGKPSRPCPPKIWAEAMGQMVERRERITRPLPNHNYLRQVAWQLADEADANGEKQRHTDALAGAMPQARIASLNPLAKLMEMED